MSDNQQISSSEKTDFTIRQISEIPEVAGFIKSKTKRNDLGLDIQNDLQKHSFHRKGDSSLSIAELQTDFIVEKQDGDITYYVFNIENLGNEQTIYNLEIKQSKGIIERTRIIEYSSDKPFSEEPATDLLQFTGTVTSYSINGEFLSSKSYNSGKTTDCPNNDNGGGTSTGGTGMGGIDTGNGESGNNSGSGGFWFFNGGFYYNSTGSGGNNGSGGSSSGASESGCDPDTYVVIETIYNPTTGEPMGEVRKNDCGVTYYTSELTHSISQNRTANTAKQLISDCVETAPIIILNANTIFRQYLRSYLPTYAEYLMKSENKAFYEEMKIYFFQQKGSEACREILQKAAHMKYKIPSLSWGNFLKWESWLYNYLAENYVAETYFNNHPEDLEYIFFDDIDINDWEDMETAYEAANVITDILIAKKNGTLDYLLNSNWIDWNNIKQRMVEYVKSNIPKAVKLGRRIYKFCNDHLSENDINKMNAKIIDPMRNFVKNNANINFDVHTMKWKDIVACWLFELGDYPVNNSTGYTLPTLGFAGADYVISGIPNQLNQMRYMIAHKTLNNGAPDKNSVMDLKRLVILQIKAGDLSSLSREWHFGSNATVDTIMELDGLQFCLGSYITTVNITPLGNNQY